MLMGHADWVPEQRSSTERLLPHHESNVIDDIEVSDSSEPILYSASFEELASSIIHYDMVIWFSISLLLVLAWGVGVLMLLYLPIRRYVLQKDISSRKLYVTPREIVYKATGSTRHSYTVPRELLLHKLDEVCRSVKKIEVLMEKSQNTEDK